MDGADEEWFHKVAERLQGKTLGQRKRISLGDVREIFAEVFAHRPGIPQRRDWLLESLRYAERKGFITLPKTKKTWDYSGSPALPKYVTQIQETLPPEEKWWQAQHWHPQLDWVADLNTLKDDYSAFLLKVQEGLIKDWFKETAPLKYRSLQLTDDEKRLEKLIKSTVLFAPGHLSVDLLNLASDFMPLAHEIVGKVPVALVFENKEPYNEAAKVLRQLPSSPYGVVAYGGGNSFKDSVRYFEHIQELKFYKDEIRGSLTHIDYVGDFDWPGLTIAHDVARKAQENGLPPIKPATAVHKLMLEALRDPTIERPDGFPDRKTKRKRKSNPSSLRWLSEDISDEVSRILDLGNRVPEEMLTAGALRALWSERS